MLDTDPTALNWQIAPQHILAIAVRDRDIDAFNHVNNVVYLRWMADTAWDHSKKLGFDFAAYEARDCGFVVTRHEIDYRQAALLGDIVHVATWISRNDGRVKLRRRFQMISERTGQTLAFGMTEFASMKLSSARAVRMHEDYITGYPVDAAAAAHFSD